MMISKTLMLAACWTMTLLARAATPDLTTTADQPLDPNKTSENQVTCYVTVMKSPCWQDFDVSVEIMDGTTQKALIAPLHIKDDVLWQRHTFPCYPRQPLQFTATFSPFIWKSDEGKEYEGNHLWHMPDKVEPGVKIWHISVCYPTDFTSVPVPPTAKETCTCDYTKQMVPALSLDDATAKHLG